MNTKALLFLFSFCFILFFVVPTSAQIPPQLSWYGYLQPMHETAVSTTQALASQGDMASDGIGHHYVAPNSTGSITHYLFDNVGTLLSSTNFGTTSSVKPAITARNGLLHVALHNTNSNRIELYESADGGLNWPTGSVPFQDVQGTLDGLDAFEDDRGVHITYSSSTGIYYHMRNVLLGNWAFYASTVYSGNAANAQPAITASTFDQGDSAHVLSAQGMFSFKFPNSGSGQWESRISPFVANSTLNSIVVFKSEGSGWLGNYIMAVSEPDGQHYFRRPHREYGSSDNWHVLAASQPNDWAVGKSSVVVAPGYPNTIDWANFVYCENFGVERYRVILNKLKAASYDNPPTFGPIEVTQVSETVFRAGSEPAVGANQGSVAVLWRDHQTPNYLYFRRKPYPIVGGMNENHVLTDTNWVLGTTTVVANKEIRLKSGSTTYLSGEFSYGGQTKGPGKFVISDGASLVIESGAELILQPPTGTYTQGGSIECAAGGTVTVEGALLANAGGKLLFGSGSTLVVNGTLTASGTSGNPVVFTRIGTSGTWGGIVVDNCDASPGATLSYATLSHCGTGISTRLSAKFGMDHCTLDDMEIGLEIDPTQGDCPTTGPAIQITNSTFTHMSATGILVNSFSNLTLQGNTINQPPTSPYSTSAGITCISASPKLLGNTIEDYPIGLNCLSGSSPVLEDGNIGGYNVITKNGVGVLCQDGSNTVLGFLSGNMNDVGGMNSIAKNDDFDVSLSDDCDVRGENNWWGSKDDPPGNFDIDGSSKFDYNPWLDSDPNRIAR